jgi:hypothetical protein
MIPAFDRHGRRSLIASVVFCVVLIVFVAGAQRQAKRIGVLGPAHAQIRTRAAERSQQIEAWDPVTEQEREAWRAITERLEILLPERDTRLVASARLTALAVDCGLREVTLMEVYEEFGPGSYDQAEWGDDLGDAGESYAEEGNWVRVSDGSDGDDLLVRRFEFEMSFLTTYEGLTAFLERLGKADVLIEAHTVTITREAPWLRATMILAAYGRER